MHHTTTPPRLRPLSTKITRLPHALTPLHPVPLARRSTLLSLPSFPPQKLTCHATHLHREGPGRGTPEDLTEHDDAAVSVPGWSGKGGGRVSPMGG